MAAGEKEAGDEFDRVALDRVERRFWRAVWESVPAAVREEHGVELRDFGPVQVSIARGLAEAAMLNLVLGATEPGAVGDGHLAAAAEWVASTGVSHYVPVTPGLAETDAAEDWLTANGFAEGYSWMKFVRGAHPPRFAVPADVEVVELSGGEEDPFGTIAATGSGLPAWASTFFANLPECEGWHCYVARLDGIAQACAAMFIDDGIAEFGIAATLEAGRRRGCQLALLRRRIDDAIAAGCRTLFVETGERTPGRPSSSYANILRAGFREAYLRPNWVRSPAQPR
jgi:hypothetical protein